MHYADLLRLRYEPRGRDPFWGVDCFWLAQEVCRRVGRELESEDPLETRCERIGDTWHAAVEPGDLIVSDTVERGLHVSPLVDAHERLALSCCRERPLVYAVPAWSLPSVVGVWRAPRAEVRA